MSKGKPIPVRFEDDETTELLKLSRLTGLTVADLIRRSVRLFARATAHRGIWPVIEETAVPLAHKVHYLEGGGAVTLVTEEPHPTKAPGKRAKRG